MELVPVGSSREQVLLALGSPSTTATFDNEVFYYISQKRVRPVAFMEPRLVDQKVLAGLFQQGRPGSSASPITACRTASCFDFISRTTPTGGQDRTFLGQILSDTTGAGAPSRGQFGRSPERPRELIPRGIDTDFWYSFCEYRKPLERDEIGFRSLSRSKFFVAHDLFRKPVPTLTDHDPGCVCMQGFGLTASI